MSDPSDIAARTQRFNEAVRGYTPPSPSRHAKLMPFKDGIVELRQKGGSLRLIRVLLATVNVAVGTDTIATFIAEVTGEPAQPRTPDRRRRKRPVNFRVTQARPAAESAPAAPLTVSAPQLASPIPTPGHAPTTDTLPERSRIRGPRIADPRNL
jgi:hypothetical protein